jgi:hypothetical protein
VFAGNSRYARAGTYIARGPTGESVVVTRIPAPARPALAGFHRRQDGQRLDLVAFAFLRDETLFWRLCDANDTVVPDVLSVAELIGIPRAGS